MLHHVWPTRGNLHTGIQYVICFWGSPEKRGKGPHFNGYLEDPGRWRWIVWIVGKSWCQLSSRKARVEVLVTHCHAIALTIRPSAENAELPTLKSREPLWIKELDPFTINQVNSNTCRARLEDHGELPTLKNCKGLLATLEREPDSSQKQVMLLSEQKRVSERMVRNWPFMASWPSQELNTTPTRQRPQMHPNTWTRLPETPKKICHLNFVALKLYKFILISSMSISKVHLRIHLPKSHGFPIGPSTETPKVPGPRTAQLILHLNQVSRPGFFRFGLLKSPRSKKRWYVYHCKPIPKWVVYDIVLLTWDGFLMK